METPPARGRDAAMLQRQLDSASGQRLQHRRVSRSLQLEDSFFTPATSPHEMIASNARFGQQSQTQAESPFVQSSRRQLREHPGHSPRQIGKALNNIDLGIRSGGGFEEALRAGANGSASLNAGLNASPHNESWSSPSTRSRGASQEPQRSPAKNPARALSSRRQCAKCQGEISGHFVRALGEAFHIDCFTCEDCGVPCAAKFFPLDNKPLCERCYFKRRELLCYRCGNSLRGSYITALDRKYHVEHFTCSLCTTVFGPDDSYFEYNGDLFCRAHYSSLFAFHCEGCKSPILRQFVETYRGGKQQQWHPECYMIFKFWSVKISDPKAEEMRRLRADIAAASDSTKPLDPRAAEVIAHEERIDKRTMRTWTTLCGFEEACAAEISELVQHAVNGKFQNAYETCARLVAQVKTLFVAIDIAIKPSTATEPSSPEDASLKEPGKEAKTLCRKIVSYMSLLSKTRQLSDRERVQGLTQRHLLALASAIAHYLKVLIRQGLSGALKSHSLGQYLRAVGRFSEAKPANPVSPFSTDQCQTCNKAVEDRCYRFKGRNDLLWHARSSCFRCSKTGEVLELTEATVDANGKLLSLKAAGPGAKPAPITSISRLEQYAVLLHVALARLELVLSNNRRPKSQEASPSRSDQEQHMDRTSSSTPTLPGQRSEAIASSTQTPQSQKEAAGSASTTLERTSLILHEKAGLTLDDIRRIVAAEQAKTTVDGSKSQPQLRERPSQAPLPAQQQSQAQPLPTSQPQSSSVPSQTTRYYGTLSDDEYSWARQIAQAMLQPYAVKYMKRELEEVTSTTKTPTLWGRMGKVFAKEQDGRVFGQPLDRLVAKYGVDSGLVSLDSNTSIRYTLRIPSFVDDCVQAMRQKDMSAEGVFRKNGNIRRLREFVEKIDRNPDENGLLVDESPIQLAALLKKFLRDLPDPLLCSKLTPMWTLLSKLEGQERIRVAQLLTCVLPKPNRSLLEVLVDFLNWVSSFAHVDEESGSKMDITNLATVLGPTLLLSNEEAEGRMAVSEIADGNGTGDSSHSFKNVGESIKLLIADYGLVAQLPPDVARCLKHVKGVPHRVSAAELQDLLKQG